MVSIVLGTLYEICHFIFLETVKGRDFYFSLRDKYLLLK